MTARAGKDLVSCLVSGLLTIGPRFGGAVDDAARYFQDACDRGAFLFALLKAGALLAAATCMLCYIAVLRCCAVIMCQEGIEHAATAS